MKYRKYLFISIIVSLLCSSCAPSVKFVSNGDKREPKPIDYTMLFIHNGDRLSNDCITLGEIEVYDAGLAVNCGFNAVLLKTIDEAKRIGADAIKIIEVKPPDMLSTCYRIKALAFGYNGNDTGLVTYEKILAPMDILDSSFIAFTDCGQCKEFGNTDSITKASNKIMFLEVGIFTSYIDAEPEIDHYPITESRMNEHIHLLLESYNWKLKHLSNDAEYYKQLSDYYTELLKKIFHMQDNPLEWNFTNQIDIEDSSTLIYIPIIIQREAQKKMGGRFYTLIADNKGKIKYFNSLGFNPEIWSRNFNKFANDIEGKLPLAKE